MVYHSLVYSRLQYGIIIWATDTTTLLQEIRVLQNNIIRILTYNKKFSHVTPLYKKLNLLKFDDIYKLELAKFMYLLQQSSLPSGIFDKFTKIEQIHGYNTRQASELIYYVPKFSKSISQNHILFRATKLWRELNKNFKSMGLINFKKSYKISLLENY